MGIGVQLKNSVQPKPQGLTLFSASWSELGNSLAGFPTAKHLASWLSLCPDNKISGGKTLKVSTRATANRVARILRVAAQRDMTSSMAPQGQE